MHTVGSQAIWSYLSESDKVRRDVSNEAIRTDGGLRVSRFAELASRVAELQYRNPDLVLMFRGQKGDYKMGGTRKPMSTMVPSIFRGLKKDDSLVMRLEYLKRSSSKLISIVGRIEQTYARRLRRQKILSWALLQHYGVCSTPLLDVTTSVRVAASFASMDADTEAYFFVLAAPSISGSITASAEAEMQIVRLSNACPPMAMRPHLQEGYMLGEYPDYDSHIPENEYKIGEVDVARRIIAKFRLILEDFWNDDFPMISRRALYPDPDPLKDWLKPHFASVLS